MQTFGQRRDPLRLFGRRILMLALLVLAVVRSIGVWGVYQKERESRSLRADSEAQLADLKSRKAQLETDIAKLKTDRGMEAALREQYQLAKSGEGLIVIVDPPTPQPIATTSTMMQWFQKSLSWW